MRLIPLLSALAMLSSLHAADKPVPVVQEPYHKVVFENDYVRMIDVQIPVRETTQYHVHQIASVVVYLTKSSNASQTWGENGTTPRLTTPGDSRYANYDEKSLTHRVTNTGANLFRVYDIELLHPPTAKSMPEAPAQGVKPKWDQQRVRSSNLTLAPGGSADLTASDCAYLVVSISGNLTTRAAAERTAQPVKLHGFVFHPAKSAVVLQNTGRDPAEAVVLELK